MVSCDCAGVIHLLLLLLLVAGLSAVAAQGCVGTLSERSGCSAVHASEFMVFRLCLQATLPYLPSAGPNPTHLLQGHAAGVGAAAVARPAAAVGPRRQDGAGGCSCSLLAKANCHVIRVTVFAWRFALGLPLCIAQPVPLPFVCLAHAIA